MSGDAYAAVNAIIDPIEIPYIMTIGERRLQTKIEYINLHKIRQLLKLQ